MQQYSSGARPKRVRHPPRHLEDYELDYPRGKPQNTPYSSTVPYEHGHEEDEYHHQEGAAKMTSLTSSSHSPYRLQGKRDQEKQYSSFGFYQELEVIREENTRLREAQLAIHRDFGQLHSLRKDMRSLADSVRSLQEAQAATVSHAPIRSLDLQPGSGEWPDDVPPPAQALPSAGEQCEEEEWPEPPPPWPEPEEQPQRNKVADLLDQVMHELQEIRFNTPSVAKTHDRPAAVSAPPPDKGRLYQVGLFPKQLDYGDPQQHPPQSSSTPIQRQPGLQADTPAAQWAPPQPALPPQGAPAPKRRPAEPSYGQSYSEPPRAESSYRGPRPTVPDFSQRDPSQFARLKIALENLLPADATELFKYQILTDHLKLEEACLVADSYLHSPTPYSDTMAALNEKFGQPYQVALKRIDSVMTSPDICRGDTAAFERFALRVQSLVGMLKTLGPAGEIELQCGSHVARLLSKLPLEMRSDFRRCMFRSPGTTYTLQDFTDWLQYETWCQDFDGNSSNKGQKGNQGRRSEGRYVHRTTSVFHGAKDAEGRGINSSAPADKRRPKAKAYCPYCDNEAHYLNHCSAIQKLTKAQITE
ncbi:uncharacterized protein LOC130176585 [Seriola aureovittata]|uniref:uncharacterized protein LOC130176585 n=1 Tax=Seriola aureovittata TaxID=2871759 RepID=UPI0024BE0FF3|nr:uncharacterized protein LOC130176585 [Seriola aureovittata]